MIPPFQELMLPIMRLAKTNGQASTSNREFIDRTAEEFRLSEEDRKELLASGRQSRFENRVYWALVHLRRAGLIESSGRGLNRITERGHNILRQVPSRIDLKLLSQFPEFREFRKSKAPPTASVSGAEEETASPAEQIETAFAELRESLVTELLLKLGVVDPFRFEKVVLDLLVGMGYGG